MKGLTREAADELRKTHRRRRYAGRVLRARRAGITDPAALASIWSGARVMKTRTSNAPTRAKGGFRTSLEPLLTKRRGELFGKRAR